MTDCTMRLYDHNTSGTVSTLSRIFVVVTVATARKEVEVRIVLYWSVCTCCDQKGVELSNDINWLIISEMVII